MSSTFYIDLVNGNDTNNGLSFAQRVRSISRINSLTQPGDTVLVMESAPPNNSGLKGTWTKKSTAVSLNGSITKSLFNGTWSPGSVTITLDGTNRKYSQQAVKLNVQLTSPLGKLASVQIGAADFRSYGQISFWIYTWGIIFPGVFSIRLCSDGNGNTPVMTIPIPATPSNNHWIPITINTGTLPASVGSVAIYLDKNGTCPAIMLDNIVACLPAGPTAVTHNTLIGKPNSLGVPGGDDTEGWFAIAGLGDNVIQIDQHVDSTAPNMLGYYGTSEQVTLWTREPIQVPLANSAFIPFADVTKGGTISSLVNWQFGMNTAGMTTQTGYTWVTGQNGLGIGLRIYAPFTAITRFGVVRFYHGIALIGSNGGRHEFAGAAHCTIHNLWIQGPSASNTITAHHLHHAGSSGFNSRPNGGKNDLNLKSVTSNGMYGVETAANDKVHDGKVQFNSSAAFITSGAVRIYRYQTDENGYSVTGGPGFTQGLQGSYYQGGNFDTLVGSRVDQNLNFFWDTGTPPFPGIPHEYRDEFTIRWTGFITAGTTENYTFTAVHDDGVRIWINGQLLLNNWNFWRTNFPEQFQFTFVAGQRYTFEVEFVNFVSAATMQLSWQSATVAKQIIHPSSFSKGSQMGAIVVVDPLTSVGYEVNLHDCKINEGRPFGGFQSYLDTRIRSHNHMAQKGNHMMVTDGGQVVNETGIDRHTLSGFAWKMQPSSPRSNLYPLDYKLASLAVLTSKPVTVYAWIKRSDGNVTGQLLIPGGQLDGVPLDLTISSSLVSTYERLSITFTPAETGIIEVYARAYGGSGSSVWIDDMAVTQ